MIRRKKDSCHPPQQNHFVANRHVDMRKPFHLLRYIRWYISVFCMLRMLFATNICNHHHDLTCYFRACNPIHSQCLGAHSKRPAHANKVEYGENLNIASCLEALDQIDEHSTVEQSYGERYKGVFDVKLPIRYVSCSLPLSN